MRNRLLILFSCACALSFKSHAQVNLVRNPSFEQDTACPFDNQQVSFSNYWTGIDSSWVYPGGITDPLCNPNYDNTCATDAAASVPDNAYFYHYARTGIGMMEVILYDDGITFGELITEYLQGRLYTPLVAGQSYCVTFYVVRAQGGGYANNNIGAYLDDGSIDTASVCGNYQTEYTPQINETAIITDTLNWTMIQGSFIANGTERVITIGNFFDTTNTEHIKYSLEGEGIYLVDDVSVIASNATAYAGPDQTIALGDTAWLGDTAYGGGAGMPCYWYVPGNPNPIDSGGSIAVTPTDTTTPATYVVMMDLCGTVTYDTVIVTVQSGSGIKAVAAKAIQVYPNPASNELNIDNAAGSILTICNMLGQMVYQDNIITAIQTEHISGLVDGVYIVQLTNNAGEKKNVELLKE